MASLFHTGHRIFLLPRSGSHSIRLTPACSRPEPLGIGTNNGRVLPSVSAVLLGAWRPAARGASPEDDSADDGRTRTLISQSGVPAVVDAAGGPGQAAFGRVGGDDPATKSV